MRVLSPSGGRNYKLTSEQFEISAALGRITFFVKKKKTIQNKTKRKNDAFNIYKSVFKPVQNRLQELRHYRHWPQSLILIGLMLSK